MDHYIVKIYRKEAQTAPLQIAGMVENMANQQCSAFRNADELVAILGTAPRWIAEAETSADHREFSAEPKSTEPV